MKPSFWYGAIAALLALPASAFDLHSRDVRDGGTLTTQQVYQGFGCEGGNRAPQLTWAKAPVGTKSFAVTVYDPDAPTGSGWWHWVAYDIPATVTTIDGGAVPAGARQGRNDYGTKAFGGACPPLGDKPHRYIFTVHALKVDKLEVPEEASAALIGYMINANRLGKATLTAKYGR
ncbi:YbhB/YbcL family Raf kinase inhibitor-like protein [Pseudoduganella armeniaca]|uniref:YbhB/YbcL family Raf kinase inhibitor-like protein n=1 Tax=Pseudoduganella armeniaca TaxID=2072590 RepID=A0A2R4CHU4_9BURK|nr:YbhB/YbcL family Raf kinase inhibitor-like protein [Pseudoduganella armeniaca]AVR99028.1 YbhB/YbcL family Raf kinase inhibitor-like protein [Pseudoduganella armeniaca]